MLEFERSNDNKRVPRTGIDVIDSQHGEIWAEIAKLQAANHVGRGGALLEDIFIYLADYTETHFAFEEYVMKGSQYPGLEAHRQSHLAFTRRFGELRHRYETANPEEVPALCDSIATWLGNWLESHVAGEDSTMAEFLTRQGKARQPARGQATG